MRDGEFGSSNAVNEPRVRGGLAGAVTAEEFDAMAAVGGWRGIIESVLPTVVFLVLYVSTHHTVMAVCVALAISLLAIVVRAVQRVPVAPALGGLFAMAISAVLAWRTGQAANVFLWGILTNGAYACVIAISIAVRWPLLGVLIAWARGEGMAWRNTDTLVAVRRRYYRVTWLWLAMFAVRLGVQLPLYYAQATEALGIAKLALGLPLFALVVWFSWLMTHKPSVVSQAPVQAESHLQPLSK